MIYLIDAPPFVYQDLRICVYIFKAKDSHCPMKIGDTLERLPVLV